MDVRQRKYFWIVLLEAVGFKNTGKSSGWMIILFVTLAIQPENLNLLFCKHSPFHQTTRLREKTLQPRHSFGLVRLEK